MLFKTYRRQDNHEWLVNALQVTSENAEEVALTVGGYLVEEIDALNHTERYVGINFKRWGNAQRASENDFIYRLADGYNKNYHVMKPGEFLSKFEEV